MYMLNVKNPLETFLEEKIARLEAELEACRDYSNLEYRMINSLSSSGVNASVLPSTITLDLGAQSRCTQLPSGEYQIYAKTNGLAHNSSYIGFYTNCDLRTLKPMARVSLLHGLLSSACHELLVQVENEK